MKSRALRCFLAAALLFGLASCAIHPRGEREERDLARSAYPKPPASPLRADATLKEILEYAYASNADLERLYWEWVSAIEAIPEEASPMTNLAISVESMFEEGRTSLKQTTLGVGNDPMTNIPWPGKLSTAGRRALEMARAAGFRFQAAKLDLRARVLGAYYDYALLAESVRLKQSEVSLIGMGADATAARVRTGAATSPELLTAQNASDLANSELLSLNSKIPGQLAALNALLSREPASAIDLPGALPPARDLPYTDAEILAFLAERNPELAALAHEARANEQAVSLMRQQYIPDLGLTASGDLGGMTRSIMVMLTAPIVRREAIEASIRQAKAELSASRAMRRQAENDLKAETVLALYDLRDAERQAALLDGTIVPRIAEMADVARASYSAGQTPIGDAIESERMLLAMKQMSAEMHMEREKMLADIEKMAGLTP